MCNFIGIASFLDECFWHWNGTCLSIVNVVLIGMNNRNQPFIIVFPVLSGETFSENFSHTEKCQPCTQCTGLLRMETPCTDSNDATCVCNYGYYLNKLSQQCEPCTKCPEGQGMLYSCEADHDTVCEECNGDTYSDQESHTDPCIPCTTCDEGVTVVEACTSVSDTVCPGKTISKGS